MKTSSLASYLSGNGRDTDRCGDRVTILGRVCFLQERKDVEVISTDFEGFSQQNSTILGAGIVVSEERQRRLDAGVDLVILLAEELSVRCVSGGSWKRISIGHSFKAAEFKSYP